MTAHQELALRPPLLVQRLEFHEGLLGYQSMGSSGFESGQSQSLERIVEAGMEPVSLSLNVGGKDITVYMIAGKDFPFFEYRRFLREFVHDESSLQARIHFNALIHQKAGFTISGNIPKVQGWFDFQNDVLWTISKEDDAELRAILKVPENS